MGFIAGALPYIQVVLSILLIAAILLQQRGSSLGGAFGGDQAGTTFYTRRGAERRLFQATIALGILFALSAFAALFV
jgi:protein translocase SecG subunit